MHTIYINKICFLGDEGLVEEIFDEEEEEEAVEEPHEDTESSRQDLDTSRLLAAGVSVTIIEKSR
jgi:hypothetical protein